MGTIGKGNDGDRVRSVIPSCSKAMETVVRSDEGLRAGVLPECVSDEDELGDFKGVVWNAKGNRKKLSVDDDDIGPGPEAGPSEGVQRVDWAMKAAMRRETM